MITITSKKGFQHGFKTEGHALYAEHGQDIVCASVSVLTQTALLGLLRFTDVQYQMSPGFLDVTLVTMNVQTFAILETLRLGLEQIAEQYPEHVQIKEKNGVKFSG